MLDLATAAGATVFGTSASADTLVIVDTATMDVSEVTLEGFDTWVMGVAHLDGVVRILDDGRDDPAGAVKIRDFDPITGTLIREISVGTWGSGTVLRGLWCAQP